ncbi:unnamed protein product [Peronospora belbahrii]|nr:unnamed protein product [Peronospora belbahrii]
MEEGLPFVMEKWWRKVSTPTSMAKVELIFPKVEETIDLEAGEEVNSSNEEEDARLLLSADEDQDIEVLELSKETIR